MQSSDLIILCILLGCMSTYVPVFLCLFFTATFGFVVFLDMPLALLAQTLFRSLDKFALVVVLFFIHSDLLIHIYQMLPYVNNQTKKNLKL